MENEQPNQKLKAVKQQALFDRFFYWQYDDGSYGTILYDTATGDTDRFRSYGNKSNLQWAINKHQKAGAEPVQFSLESGITKSVDKSHAIEAAVGLDVLQDGFLELQRLFSGYAKDESPKEILSLFSLILSGYIARVYFNSRKKTTLYFSRAPIVLIRKNKKDLCGGFEHLARIAESLIVDTGHMSELTVKNPPIIPSKKRSAMIERSAYTRLFMDNMKRRFPTQYRDTAVLIHSSFFTDNALRNFVERNKWTTVLLFNKAKSEWKYLFAEIDMNNMTMAAWDWDPGKLHCLMNRYVVWLSSRKGNEDLEKHLKIWKRTAKKAVHAYNLASVTTREKIKQGSEWDLACLQITALCSFVAYIYQEEILDRESCNALFDTWVNTLLPGSRSQDVLEKSNKTDQEVLDKATLICEFEELLKMILEYENGSKVYPMARGDEYPGGPDLSLDIHHWAFLSEMKTDSRGKKVPVIKLRYEELFKLADKFGLLQGKNAGQAKLKGVFSSGEKPRYIHKWDNARINFANAKETEKSPGAITLIVGEMDFLDEKIRQKFMTQLSKVQ